MDKTKYPYWSVAALSPSNPFYIAGPIAACGQCFEIQCLNSGGQFAVGRGHLTLYMNCSNPEQCATSCCAYSAATCLHNWRGLVLADMLGYVLPLS